MTQEEHDIYPTPCTGAHRNVTPYNHDKLNKVDFSWFIVRTLPHQERKLADMLAAYQAKAKNILEVYCPTHTTVSVSDGGKQEDKPLFAGYVFVHSTQEALTEFIDSHYPEGIVMYGRRLDGEQRAALWTIPEDQMRAFKDFNENYADRVVILERPFTDYAFNPKTGEPNEIVKVVDGPLKGCEGYLARFKRERRIVFNICQPGTGSPLTVSIPDAWSLRVVRLHNAEGDRQAIATQKERAADLLLGVIQACGYGDKSLGVLYSVTDYLAQTPTMAGLCRHLLQNGHAELSQKLGSINTKDAGLLLNLARYEHDFPGYVRANWQKLIIRPFLTPTPGVPIGDGKDEARLEHKGFTEVISRVGITELAYQPSKRRELTVTTTYFAHTGIMPHPDGRRCTVFANWDAFLGEYYLTAGKANERLVSGTAASGAATGENNGRKSGTLIDSFHNFAPTLYNILTDETSRVKAVKSLNIAGQTLNAMAIETDTEDADEAVSELVRTCTAVCTEINSTPHLAAWRRYLRTVWLHE